MREATAPFPGGAKAGAPGDGRRPADVVVYGARTCEDTAITRSRLRALGVPFAEVDVDEDPAGLARVLELEGRRVTPTVVVGDEEAVVAEPSVEEVDELLAATGHSVTPPTATHLHGAVTERAIFAPPSVAALRGRRQVALLFAHGATCLACLGYARQLAGQAGAMAEVEGVVVVVVRDTVDGSRTWAQELPDGVLLLADPDGTWRTRATPDLEAGDPSGVALVVLDRYLAPRAVSAAPEAGGLIGPADATDWLRFVALDCPECYGGATWPD